jgi:hypothetical protein
MSAFPACRVAGLILFIRKEKLFGLWHVGRIQDSYVGTKIAECPNHTIRAIAPNANSRAERPSNQQSESRAAPRMSTCVRTGRRVARAKIQNVKFCREMRGKSNTHTRLSAVSFQGHVLSRTLTRCVCESIDTLCAYSEAHTRSRARGALVLTDGHISLRKGQFNLETPNPDSSQVIASRCHVSGQLNRYMRARTVQPLVETQTSIHCEKVSSESTWRTTRPHAFAPGWRGRLLIQPRISEGLWNSSAHNVHDVHQ